MRVWAHRQTGVPEVTNNANDGDVGIVTNIGSGRQLQECWWSEVNAAADGIFVGEVAFAKFIADERNGRTRCVIRLCEITAFQERNAERFEEVIVGNTKLRFRNVFNAGDRLVWQAKHLKPAVVGRKGRGYGGFDNAGLCANAARELVAEARDGAGVGIANWGQIEMTFEQVILANPESLVLEAEDALG